ncbi:MAG TPA: hypothetical protein VLA71_12515 [Algoriphagus sp.]|nr:hypothetical protein [Algoriphagus sp.]
MKLGDVLILSLALALGVIGIHQSITVGIENSYFLFMLSVGMLFWFQLRRNKAIESEKAPPTTPKQKKKR